jgi:hypothetical protein
VPSHGRVIGAKASATFLVGVVSKVVAFAVGAIVGYLVVCLVMPDIHALLALVRSASSNLPSWIDWDCQNDNVGAPVRGEIGFRCGEPPTDSTSCPFRTTARGRSDASACG